MRILFGSWPGHGHLLPMVPLIRAAQGGGHDVVVSSGSDMANLVGQLGVTAPIGSRPSEGHATSSRGTAAMRLRTATRLTGRYNGGDPGQRRA